MDIAQNLNVGHILKNNSQIRMNYALYLIMNVPSYLAEICRQADWDEFVYEGALPNGNFLEQRGISEFVILLESKEK